MVDQQNAPEQQNEREPRQLGVDELVELAVYRTLRENIDSHVAYISKISVWTASIALALLALFGAAVTWVGFERLDSVVTNLEPTIREKLEERVSNKIADVDEQYDLRLNAAVNEAVSKREGDIETLITQYLKEEAATDLLGRVSAEYGDMPAHIRDLGSRLTTTERNIGEATVLAVVRVSAGRVETALSSDGVSINDGWVTFQNPGNLPFIPIVSDYWNQTYATQTHYIRAVVEPNRFRVWQTALDTGDRGYSPTDFTAIVVGIR